MGRMGPDAGRGAMRRAFACRALRLAGKASDSHHPAAPAPRGWPLPLPAAPQRTPHGLGRRVCVSSPPVVYLRIFRAGWLNQVATRRCQSLWKCGFRIMPFRLGAMAAYGREEGGECRPAPRVTTPSPPAWALAQCRLWSRGASTMAARVAAPSRWQWIEADEAQWGQKGTLTSYTGEPPSGKEVGPQSTLGWQGAWPIRSAATPCPISVREGGSDAAAAPSGSSYRCQTRQRLGRSYSVLAVAVAGPPESMAVQPSQAKGRLAE
jgi:hypothetical protein